MIHENLYTPNTIRTFTGKYIDPFNPDPALINIVDIAHALSHIPRFGGHSKYFLSVAQHSLSMTTSFNDPQDRLTALLHDASEAYLLDMPKPIKDRLPDYQIAEENLMKIIAKKYGFHYPLPIKIKRADNDRLESEWSCLVLKSLDLRLGSPKNDFIELYNCLRGSLPHLPEADA